MKAMRSCMWKCERPDDRLTAVGGSAGLWLLVSITTGSLPVGVEISHPENL